MKKKLLFFFTICSLLVLAQSPKAKFSTTVIETAQTNSIIKFSNLSEGDYTSYSWSFPGGNPSVSSDTNPVVTYIPGTYTAELTVSNGTESSKISTSITISAGGILDVTTGRKQDGTLYAENATDPNWKYRNLFSDTNLLFDAATIGVYGQWSLPDRADLLGLGQGRYFANRATADNALKGYQHEYTRTFDLPEDGVLNFRALADEYVTVYLDDNELGSTFFADPAAWPPRGYWNSWACDPRTPDTKEVRYDIPVSKGTHVLKALVRNVVYGTGFTLNGNIKYGISIVPVAGFSVDQTKALQGTPVKFTYNSEGIPVSYFWEFQDGAQSLTSTEASPSVLFENTGYHKVKLKVTYANGKVSTFSSDSYIEITPKSNMSIEELNTNQKSNIQISPNPTTGIFKVLLKDIKQEGIVTVLDISGKELYSKPFEAGGEIEVNIQNRPAGVYIVKVQAGKQTIINKIIKK